MQYEIKIRQLSNGTWEVTVTDPTTTQLYMQAWGFNSAATAAQLGANVVQTLSS